MSRIPSIRRSCVLSQIGLIVVVVSPWWQRHRRSVHQTLILLLWPLQDWDWICPNGVARGHHLWLPPDWNILPSWRWLVLISVENNLYFTKCCCQNVELQKNIITVIIHTSIHTSVVKVNYHSDILYFTNAGVKMSSRSIITLIVSWPGWRHEQRHEEVNCMTRRRQGGQHPLISFMPLCQVLPGYHLQRQVEKFIQYGDFEKWVETFHIQHLFGAVSYGGQRYSIAIPADSEMWVKIFKLVCWCIRHTQAGKGQGSSEGKIGTPQFQNRLPSLNLLGSRWLVSSWGLQ